MECYAGSIATNVLQVFFLFISIYFEYADIVFVACELQLWLLSSGLSDRRQLRRSTPFICRGKCVVIIKTQAQLMKLITTNDSKF